MEKKRCQILTLSRRNRSINDTYPRVSMNEDCELRKNVCANKVTTIAFGIVGSSITIPFCIFEEASFVIFSLHSGIPFLLGFKELVGYDELETLDLAKNCKHLVQI